MRIMCLVFFLQISLGKIKKSSTFPVAFKEDDSEKLKP